MKASKLMLLAVSLLLGGALVAGDGDEWQKKKRGRGGDRGGDHGGRMFGGDRGGMRGGARGMLIKDLGLTEDQQAKMKQIQEKYRDQLKKAREGLREAQKALRTVAEADNIDEQNIRALCKTVADKMAEMTILTAKMKKEFSGILTDDQKATMADKKAEMEAKREEMKKKFQERMQQRRGKRERKGKADGDGNVPKPPPTEE